MSLFNGHAERVAESVWLRLVARASMAIGLSPTEHEIPNMDIGHIGG